VTWGSFLVAIDKHRVSPRERIKRGMCPCDLALPSAWGGSDGYVHECTLPAGHFGWHLCWCMCMFGAERVIARQMRLPLEPREIS